MSDPSAASEAHELDGTVNEAAPLEPLVNVSPFVVAGVSVPCETVNQMRLEAAYAVATASFLLEVQRGSRPGAPKAGPSSSSQRYESFSALMHAIRT